MATNKKPRKAYKPSKVIKGGNLPLPITKQVSVPTKALMAVTALSNGFYSDSIGLDLIMFLALCQKATAGSREALEHLFPAFRVINSVKDRHTRTKKWGATGDELKVLRASVLYFTDLYPTFKRSDEIRGAEEAQKKLVRAVARNKCS